MITKNVCLNCQIEFEAEDWRHRKYCSKKCKGLYDKSGQFKKGRILSPEMEQKRITNLILSNPSRMRGKKHTAETIAKMREAHKHPYNYIDGGYRKKISINQCHICGTKNNNLITHHKDTNRKNNNMENLIKLCRKCHAKIHFPDGKLGKNKR